MDGLFLILEFFPVWDLLGSSGMAATSGVLESRWLSGLFRKPATILSSTTRLQ
jgi:hypothetical protein